MVCTRGWWTWPRVPEFWESLDHALRRRVWFSVVLCGAWSWIWWSFPTLWFWDQRSLQAAGASAVTFHAAGSLSCTDVTSSASIGACWNLVHSDNLQPGIILQLQSSQQIFLPHCAKTFRLQCNQLNSSSSRVSRFTRSCRWDDGEDRPTLRYQETQPPKA